MRLKKQLAGEVTAMARLLEKANGELAYSNRDLNLRELTSFMVHEMSQPLAATLADAHAALRWIELPVPDLGEAIASLNRIVDNSARMADVIDGMRALARRKVAVRVPLDLNETIQETVRLLDGQLRREQIAVTLHLGDALACVVGDRLQLQQVILSLIGNSIDAMHGAASRNREISIYTSNAPNAVQVQIRDTGRGIPTTDLERIFEPFFTTKPEGLGLGLTIVRRIIEAHAGRLSVVSDAEHGTSITFTLPQIAEHVI